MSKILKKKKPSKSRAPASSAEAKKEKEKKAARLKRRPPFSVLPGFAVYIIVFFLARLFTQALRSPISAVLYVFVIFIPFVSFLYMLVSRAVIHVTSASKIREGIKCSPVSFNMKIQNRSMFPIPYMEADMTIPNEQRVRCSRRRVRLSMMPFGFYDLADNLVFNYRGEYEIGISDLYIYDLFRMFRIRKNIDAFTSIYIMPRRLMLPSPVVASASDVNTDVSRNRDGVERAEIREIRTYIAGDHMKDIHWKLSSKAQDLMVREYAMNSGNTVYLFADLAALHEGSDPPDAPYVFPDDINEFIADSVVEITLATASGILSQGSSATAVWFDRRADDGISFCKMNAPGEDEPLYRPLATAGIAPWGNHVAKLAKMVEDTQGVFLVFITGNLDYENVRALAALATAFGTTSLPGTLQVLYINPENRIENPAQRKQFHEEIRQKKEFLSTVGITVSEPVL